VNLITFIESFAATDYFRLADGDKEQYYRDPPVDYGEFFRRLMNTIAANKEATHWVEKSPAHTLCYRKVAQHFPDARFVLIHRDLMDSVRSRIGRRRAGRVYSRLREYGLVMKTAVEYAIYSAVTKRIERKSPQVAASVTYADLVANMAGTCRRICESLEIEFEPNMASPPYPPNTSFPSGKRQREDILSRGETIIAKLVLGLSRMIPFGLVVRLGPWLMSHGRRRPMLHHWSMLCEEREIVGTMADVKPQAKTVVS